MRCLPLVFLGFTLACGGSPADPLGPGDDTSDDADSPLEEGLSDDDDGSADESEQDDADAADGADDELDGDDADDTGDDNPETDDEEPIDDELLAAQAGPPIRASTVLSGDEPYGKPPTSFATMHSEGRNSPGHVELMHDFAASIGSDRTEDCNYCHLDWEDEDVRINGTTRIARHMWDDILGQLELKSGEPFFCDSCHQGKPRFLNRDDPAAVMAWMRVNMVGKLARRDGQQHDCFTCHGEPPGIYEGLLDLWAEP